MSAPARPAAAPRQPLRLGVLVSGQGTTLAALAERARDPRAGFVIAVVTSDRPQAPALERARAYGIPVEVVPPLPLLRADASQTDLAPERALRETLERHRVDLIVLAGFLKVMRGPVLEAFAGRILNTHPALLPRYGGPGMYGRHVHEAVLSQGDRETGVSVHIVTGSLDAGPVVDQRRVPVEPGDTPERLAERLHPVEHALVISVVERFARGELPLPWPGPTEGRDGSAPPQRR